MFVWHRIPLITWQKHGVFELEVQNTLVFAASPNEIAHQSRKSLESSYDSATSDLHRINPSSEVRNTISNSAKVLENQRALELLGRIGQIDYAAFRTNYSFEPIKDIDSVSKSD